MWIYKIMKVTTSFLGLSCFSLVLYFGLCGGPLPSYSQSVSVSQKSKAAVKKGTKKKKKKIVKKTKTQVAIISAEDSV